MESQEFCSFSKDMQLIDPPLYGKKIHLGPSEWFGNEQVSGPLWLNGFWTEMYQAISQWCFRVLGDDLVEEEGERAVSEVEERKYVFCLLRSKLERKEKFLSQNSR
jgi:hypothetical protein